MKLTAFLAGRIVEAFLCGQDITAIAYRFHVAKARVEAVLRRHARRRRDR